MKQDARHHKPRISLCTVCMNRLFLLQQTLPVNLERCVKEYADFEYLVLDYNSQDGLEDWVRNTLQPYIEQGILHYYKLVYPLPEFFSHPHSRNIIFRLTTGDIVCNINADYFIETGFMTYISNTMHSEAPLALIAGFKNEKKDSLGRICMRKTDFLRTGGYDEQFRGYGYEDTDLSLRLLMSGVRLQYLPRKFCSGYLTHSDDRRIENMADYHNIQTIYWRKTDELQREVFYLYKNKRVETGMVRKTDHDIPLLLQENWIPGTWEWVSDKFLAINLHDQHNTAYLFERDSHNSDIIYKQQVFHEVSDKAQLIKMIIKKHQIRNYRLLRQRKASGNYRANPHGLGSATLLKNFGLTIQLHENKIPTTQ